MVGDGFKKDAMELKKLESLMDNQDALNKLLEIKADNKNKLKKYLANTQGINLNEN